MCHHGHKWVQPHSHAECRKSSAYCASTPCGLGVFDRTKMTCQAGPTESATPPTHPRTHPLHILAHNQNTTKVIAQSALHRQNDRALWIEQFYPNPSGQDKEKLKCLSICCSVKSRHLEMKPGRKPGVRRSQNVLTNGGFPPVNWALISLGSARDTEEFARLMEISPAGRFSYTRRWSVPRRASNPT